MDIDNVVENAERLGYVKRLTIGFLMRGGVLLAWDIRRFWNLLSDFDPPGMSSVQAPEPSS